MTQKHLNGHIESVHERNVPFKCNLCDPAFSHKASLKVHIESVHEKNKLSKCNLCDATFSHKGHLIE